MIDRPTPETDTAIEKWMQAPTPTPPEFIALGRRLERQRDAAVEALKDACLTYAVHGDQPPEKWLSVLREIEEGKS